jgi:nicotinate-nucleotide adenylyltransferase
VGEPELPVRRGTYRLGVFGSMMDPPHLGHLAVVNAVHDATDIDRIAVVPAGTPPHREAPRVSARARLTMAVRAFADLPHVVVSDTEVERAEAGEVGYMVDTLEELVELPSLLGYDDLEVQLSLIVGADQLTRLETWHRPERICELAELLVVQRPDQVGGAAMEAAVDELGERLGARIRPVPMDPVEISSTQVREVAATGDRAAIAALVPGAIVDDVLALYGP